MYKSLIFYVLLLLLFGGGILATLKGGAALHAGRAAPSQTMRPSPPGPNTPAQERPDNPARAAEAQTTKADPRDPFVILLLQVIIILLTAKMVGRLLEAVQQPTVVGEMIAGILLGPSLLGFISPPAMTFLFPAQSLDALKLLSQIGVIIFMFVVGMELDLKRLRQRADHAVIVSHASILVPLLLGTLFSLAIYQSSAPSGVTFNAFALFMGVAMSITAFPVLARILKDRGLSDSHLGGTAIACAAVDDATAWCLLAAVVAIVKADGLGGAVLTVVAALLFTGLMLLLFRPRAGKLLGYADSGAIPRGRSVWPALMLLFVSALVTERIGIHAIFGAFLAGVAMPSDSGLRTFLTERLGGLTSALLLPLFFAFTGLRTQINLLEGWRDWAMCVGVIAVAVAGKLGGSALAARWTGMGWREAVSLGILMNTRGLMELVALNIGYDLGILTPRVFSMMVVMALATTFMTGPLLSTLERTTEAKLAV